MKTSSGDFTVTDAIRFRRFDHFSDVPARDVAIVMGRLGLNGGAMRQRALRHDPHCVIAYERKPNWRWLPMAWLTLSKAGAWGNPHRVVQVFVSPPKRRRGIGKRLVRLMLARWGTRNLAVIDDGRGVTKFYKEAGLT
jgi:GNAT superfamily N-acetyltransferase